VIVFTSPVSVTVYSDGRREREVIASLLHNHIADVLRKERIATTVRKNESSPARPAFPVSPPPEPATHLAIGQLASPALAEETLSTSAKEKEAKKACALGDYQKGAEILTDLLVETNDPTYIYNQGRCYQQNGRCEQAINRFREYLRKAKRLSASDRAETESQINDCEESLAKAGQVSARPH
jgi:hypothetical protein